LKLGGNTALKVAKGMAEKNNKKPKRGRRDRGLEPFERCGNRGRSSTKNAKNVQRSEWGRVGGQTQVFLTFIRGCCGRKKTQNVL